MRCLHLASGDLWAGAEVSTYHLVRELARRPEVQADVLVFNRGELARRLAAAGVPVEVLDEAARGLPALMAYAGRRVAHGQYDVIHSHRYKESVVGSYCALRHGVAHVRTAHGRPHPGPGPLLDGALADWCGSTWIAVSQDLATELAGVRRRVHVVPNGLPDAPPPADRAALAAPFADGRDALTLGFFGRLEPVKRPDRFVDLLAALPAEIAGRPLRGVIAGGGSLAAGIRRRIEEAGLSARLKMLGHRSDADVLLPALDLLVIPSEHEGLPMVLLEAMRAGVPVAATPVGGLLEWIGDEASVVPFERLPGAVGELLASPRRHREAAARMRSRFVERGTIDRTADGVLGVYRGAMNGR